MKELNVIWGMLLLMGSIFNLAYGGDQVPGAAAKPSSYFFTGKPYDSDLGGYVFSARNYNPEMSRWTTVDPTGFPDEANNHLYVPSPTNQFDPDGWGTKNITLSVNANTVIQDIQAAINSSSLSGPVKTGLDALVNSSIKNLNPTYTGYYSWDTSKQTLVVKDKPGLQGFSGLNISFQNIGINLNIVAQNTVNVDPGTNPNTNQPGYHYQGQAWLELQMTGSVVGNWQLVADGTPWALDFWE